jgi:pyridinium-3,5-biscarboxylic acid mononucleotide sulfurtransferase
MDPVIAREAALLDDLSARCGVLVAFSGGVDSSYLAAAAVDALGGQAVAATAVSPSLAASERAAAAAVARDLGIRHVEVATDEMERAAYRRNDLQRCFHCKSALFDVLLPLAADMGLAAVAVGTITDDLADHRPGQRAAAERGVITPLADAGLSKEDVRALARRRGLPTWDKPAAPCLASRVLHGLQVSSPRLRRIEAAEARVRAALALCAGVAVARAANLRVRDLGETARVEVDRALLPLLRPEFVGLAEDLTDLGWAHVELDPAGFRSGNLHLAGLDGEVLR